MAGDSVLFTYGAPFVGVLLVAVGIAAAVPGAYGLLQNPDTCGQPTIVVEHPDEQFDGEPPRSIPRLSIADLSDAERTAIEAALTDPLGEADVAGTFPNADAFANGALVSGDGERYYVAVVSDNPCYAVTPLQFPLGVFAVALGIVGILTPPAYRRLVALEEGLLED